jgi:hypothetical protein
MYYEKLEPEQRECGRGANRYGKWLQTGVLNKLTVLTIIETTFVLPGKRVRNTEWEKNRMSPTVLDWN